MQAFLEVTQILVGVLLVVTVLLQVKGQGTGLFGAGQATFRARRGLEKTLFQFTIVLTALFLLIAMASVMVSNQVL